MQENHELTVIEGGKADELDKAGSKGWSTKLRRRAKELSAFLENGYMEMAQILYQVYDTPVDNDRRRGALYTAWGYESFAEYAEKELQIDRKRAERLRRIYYVLEVEMRGLDPALKQRIVNLGFCKVRELIRVLTVRNAAQWVKQAESVTYFTLQAAVTDERRRLGAGDAILEEGEKEGSADADASSEATEPMVPLDMPEPLTRETFAFYPAQLENVRLALKHAESLSHSDKKSHNFDLICTDFLASNDFVAGESDKRLRYLAKVERMLGLRLVAVDDNGDVLYGIKTLELAAREGET